MRYLILIPFVLILAGVHWFVSSAAMNAFQLTGRKADWLIYGIPGLLTLVFILMSVVAARYYNVFVRIFYTASATWLGVLFYLFFASIVYWIIYLVFKAFAPGINFDGKILYEALLVMVLITCSYGVINAARVRTTEISVSLPDTSQQWKGKTAVWISDIHLGDVRGQTFAESLAKKIQDLKPDIVFIGGDLYDGVAVNADQMAQPFGRISAPMGVYFITGNHEEFSSEQVYVDAVKKAGIAVLDNEMKDVDGMQIIGVDYRDSSNKDKFSQILDGLKINPSEPSILLKHVPDYLDVAESHKISMQISGHTHDGQLWPVGYVTSAIFKGYGYGSRAYGSMEVYTSDGAGTWGVPMRVGANPELVLIKFR